jgi:hypothetical protein
MNGSVSLVGLSKDVPQIDEGEVQNQRERGVVGM